VTFLREVENGERGGGKVFLVSLKGGVSKKGKTLCLKKTALDALGPWFVEKEGPIRKV